MNIRILTCATVIASLSPAQDTSRRTWDDAFRQQRSHANSAAFSPKSSALAYSLLGVTIWRLQPLPGNNSNEWTPIRTAVGAPFSVGDHVRMSIEALNPGYLYIVDREMYAGGQLGDPVLVFPTTRLRDGDPRVLPGRIIDIPAQLDKPPYFTLKHTRPDHVGEVINLLLTSEPILDLKIGAVPTPLSKQLLERWQARWGRKTDLAEMAGGAGQPWTPAEKRDLLLESDPLPQTIYRVETKPGDPILVEVPLRIKN